MASDFFLEAMQNLSECLFTTPPFDLLPTANEETAHIVPKPSTTRNVSRSERRTRPHPSQALKCPRCDSVNTKFCYYNNYNLSQPRHFCKSCRRYWTNGGVLRNIPVGGGSRKNKKSSSNIKKPSQPSKSSESYHPTALMSLHNSAPSSLYNSTSSSPTSSSSSSVMPDVDLRCIAEFNEIRRFSQGFSEFKTNNIVSGLEEICVNQHQQEVIQNSADIRETMRNSNSTDLQEMIQNSADLREIMQNSADLQHLSSMPLGSMISGSNFSGDVQGKFHNVDEISASPAFPYGLENSSLNEINLPEFQSSSYNFESLLDEWIHCNADFKAQHCWPEPGPVYLP